MLRLVNKKKTSEAVENIRLFELDSKNYNKTRSTLSMIEDQQKAIHKELHSESNKQIQEEKNKQIQQAKNQRFRVESLTKFWFLMKRGFHNLVQHKQLFIIFNIQMMLIMVTTLLSYGNLGRNYEYLPPVGGKNVDIQNRISSLFFISASIYASILLNSSLSMEEESQIIYKEISAGLYGYGAYYWSKTLVDFVLLMPPLTILVFAVLFDYSVFLFPQLHSDLEHVLHPG